MARAKILTNISLVFWSIWWHQKNISKLTDLYQPFNILKKWRNMSCQCTEIRTATFSTHFPFLSLSRLFSQVHISFTRDTTLFLSLWNHINFLLLPSLLHSCLECNLKMTSSHCKRQKELVLGKRKRMREICLGDLGEFLQPLSKNFTFLLPSLKTRCQNLIWNISQK